MPSLVAKSHSKFQDFSCLTANRKPQTESTKRLSQVDLNRLRPMRLFAHSTIKQKLELLALVC